MKPCIENVFSVQVLDVVIHPTTKTTKIFDAAWESSESRRNCSVKAYKPSKW